MMISKAEAQKQGLVIAGTEPESNFIISLISGLEAKNNMFLTLDIEDTLNQNLTLDNYTDGIASLTITSIPPYTGKGVNWQERKYYRRSEKKYYIDIRFPDYEKFCTATKDEALSMMAQQTIRATDKYLSKEKFFKYNEFKNDLVDVFKRNGII